jgi:hypothetical protein
MNNKGRFNGMNNKMNGETQEQQTPMQFIIQCIGEYKSTREADPSLILMSVDVLRSLSKEAKSMSTPGTDTLKYNSVMILLKETIMFAGIEIAVVGGEKRFTLI